MDTIPAVVKHWYQKWWGVLIIFFLSLFLIFFVASGFYVYNQIKLINAAGGVNLSNLVKERIYNAEGSADNYWFGSSDPKVTIVMFGDYSCPNSKKFNDKLRKASIKYYNDLKIIHRDYPVVSDASENLAMAARCAGEQGLFWLMNDELYKNQGQTSNDEITAMAKNIGLDITKFNSCLSQNKYKVQIEKDIADGLSFDLQGTPAWFVNGHKIMGDPPEEEFDKLIDGLIQTKN